MKLKIVVLMLIFCMGLVSAAFPAEVKCCREGYEGEPIKFDTGKVNFMVKPSYLDQVQVNSPNVVKIENMINCCDYMDDSNACYECVYEAKPALRPEGGINWWYVGAGFLVFVFLVFMFKKKKKVITHE